MRRGEVGGGVARPQDKAGHEELRRSRGLEKISKDLVARGNETACEKTREGLTKCFCGLLMGLGGSWQPRGCLWNIIAGGRA